MRKEKSFNQSEIDFVLLWVDGNDPAWQAERRQYTPSATADDREQRFRDWDNLQYWFRGVEKFAPWVHKIHFVTWGHLPPWLDTTHPKLHIVNHRDFIPSEYLPTFSCNPIELNLHRIPGLAGQFVYFNDDMFILRDVQPEDFFQNGLPCDSACLNVQCYNNVATGNTYDTAQAVGVVNKYFDMHVVLRENFTKWFNLKYGKYLLRTLYLLPFPRFPGIWHSHMPASYLKSTFYKLWELEHDNFDLTCRNRFREPLDFTQATVEFYQLAAGTFVPRKANIGMRFLCETDKNQTVYKAADFIRKQKKKLCVIYDSSSHEEFLIQKDVINEAFQSILPDKSSFEI